MIDRTLLACRFAIKWYPKVFHAVVIGFIGQVHHAISPVVKAFMVPYAFLPLCAGKSAVSLMYDR
jgi:hypothetical protein